MLKLRSAAFAVSLLLLAGCGTQAPIADELTDFNKAQQQGTAQLVLLNMLRAREGQPLSYSHFDVLRGGVNASSSVGVGLPFGPGSTLLDPRMFSAGLGVSPGISQDVKPQDDQDFYRGILTPLTQETWALYQDQNWPSDLLFHLFVEDIKLTQDDFDSIARNAARICAEHGDVAGVAGLCKGWKDDNQQLAQLPDCSAIKLLVNGKVVLDVYNDPRDRCHLTEYEAFTTELSILGFHISQQKSETDVGPPLDSAAFRDLKWPFSLKDSDMKIAKSADGRSFQFRQVSKDYTVVLGNLPCPGRADVGLAATSQLTSQIQTQAQQSANTARMHGISDECQQHSTIQIAMTTRSPDGMLYYMGEVARAELPLHPGESGQTVYVRNEGGDPRALVKLVAADDADAAVRVHYNGVTYSVPLGDDHVTMQAIELIEQIFALYNQASTAPSTTAVTVVP
ncbi:MAG TPA: hypothetical protein VH000_02040 [Rhizomicrobium sp.]|nr:hypothetical protein [Rhizomicrobium sp.]